MEKNQAMENMIRVDYKDAEKVLTDLIKPMLDGEIKRFDIGQEHDSVFIERKGNDFLLREGTKDAPIHSVGNAEQTAGEISRASGGVILYEKDNWTHTRNSGPMPLKDLLKEHDGLPSRSYMLTPEQLNTPVEQYRLNRDSIDFSLHRQNKLITLHMEQHPYLPTESKNKIIDQAAEGLPLVQTQLHEGRIVVQNRDGSIPENANEIIKDILVQTERSVTKMLDNMLDGESRKIFLGQKGEFIEVTRQTAEFRIHETGKDVAIHSSPQDVASEIMNRNVGVIIHERVQKWVVPAKELTLKDILKSHEGLPQNSENLTAKQLNTRVEQYRLTKDKVEFSFAGERKLTSIAMEKHPFLPRATKDMLLDQAATGQALVQNNQMGMSLGG
ncbi:MAG: hypothetical protein K0Q73_1982 [Paenibacillus sp.]|jgi:hypothetical protein|nr:hypothetical protein [Paenibacillus sp.]